MTHPTPIKSDTVQEIPGELFDSKSRVRLKTSGEVVDALKLRFPKTAWAFLEQVGSGTGRDCEGWADVVVMGLWPSRGMEIIGIEIKVSRSDWISELNKPKKAEKIAKYCDSWIVAVGDRSIVRAGELPSGWGLMAPDKNGLMRMEVEAPKREAQLDRSFLAAVLRRAQEQITDSARVHAEYERGIAEGRKQAQEANKYELERLSRDLDRINKTVSDFKTASGIELNGWLDGTQVGDAVRQVLHGMHKGVPGRLRNVIRELDQMKAMAEKAISDYEGKL